MEGFAAGSNGNMTVQKQTFVQPVSNRIPVPTTITNVIATLQGTATPERFYVVTGHLDSRVTDVLDFTSDAPGADDDASGVAVVMELTRLFATHQFPGTLVFATVACVPATPSPSRVRDTRPPGSPSLGRTSTTNTRTLKWSTACSSAT